MILALHQPNFIPWIGYFHKIASVDTFVILDLVDYPGGKTISNRNSIKTQQGQLELVVPITNTSQGETRSNYREVRFASINWYKKPLTTIQYAYAKAPYFKRYFPIIEMMFHSESFFRMNIDFVHFVTSELGINTRIILQSDLRGPFGAKNDLIVSICNELSAEIYLSGHGAKKYNDEAYLASKGISVQYQSFAPPTYPQLHGGFIPNLSIIDLFFNCGPDSKKIFQSTLT